MVSEGMAKPMSPPHHAAGVDADDLAGGVDQRPAGVAGADGGVGLEPQAVLAVLGQEAVACRR